MILLIAVSFTVACVAASARRLAFVIEATPIDPSVLVSRVRASRSAIPTPALATFEELLQALPGADWERELAAAFRQPVEVRPALLGEVMTELDFRVRRWGRVPRVAASLSSSFGFLLATMALRIGLSELAGTLDAEGAFSANVAVLDAVDVAAVGLVGAAFCIAIQYRARAALTARLAGAERLVELLEGFVAGDGAPLAEAEARATVASPSPTDRGPSPPP